jgi:hypothetical protein
MAGPESTELELASRFEKHRERLRAYRVPAR